MIADLTTANVGAQAQFGWCAVLLHFLGGDEFRMSGLVARCQYGCQCEGKRNENLNVLVLQSGTLLLIDYLSDMRALSALMGDIANFSR